MVLGELGRFPIEVKVMLRMISFWSRLIQSESKLSSILYKWMLSLYEQNQQTFKWIKCVESIFKLDTSTRLVKQILSLYKNGTVA